MLTLSKRKYIILTIICLLILSVFILFSIKEDRPSQSTLFENTSYNNDVLILYTNNEKSAITLTTNANIIAPIVYFDKVYDQIVYENNSYYITNGEEFLQLTQDGQIKDSPKLLNSQIVEDTFVPFNPYGNEGFAYTQKDETHIIIPYNNFQLGEFKISRIIQISDYFN